MKGFISLRMMAAVSIILVASSIQAVRAENVAQVYTECRVPKVDVDVASSLINLVNAQKITCSNKTNYISINDKSVSGVTANEMANIIRMSVFACQNPSTSYRTQPVENQCVRKLRNDIRYFLSVSWHGRVTFYPNPYAVALRRSELMGPYIDFRLWAHSTTYDVNDVLM